MSKVYNKDEVKSNDGKGGRPLWLVIRGNVYDVTGFDHPGGYDLLFPMEEGEVDVTQDFDDIGHSEYAEELLQSFKIGSFNNNGT